MKCFIIFLILFTILIYSQESYAEELYLDAYFEFFGDDRFNDDGRYLLGDTVTIKGYSSFYNEKTDEHLPAKDSVFHVVIKTSDGDKILENDYISDDDGNIEFSFNLLEDYPVGKYAVEMIVNKQKHLDHSFFVGNPDDIVQTDGEFDIWMDDSETIMLSDVALKGEFCSDLLKTGIDRDSVSLDPRNGNIIENHFVHFTGFYTNPDGITIKTSSAAEKNPCTKFGVNAPRLDVAGKWSVFVKALWVNNQTLYEAKSHSIPFQVKEPLFRGTIKDLPVEKSLHKPTVLDWSQDNSVLISYVISSNEYKWKLATMTPDGKNIVELPIDLSDRVYKSLFSPDGKFIHFLSDDKLFRYDRKTSEVLQLTHEYSVNYFDYYQYLEDNPKKYSIIVSLDRKEYSDNSSENGYVLLGIGNGENSDSLKNAHAMIHEFEGNTFDISPDGKKILFQKTLDAGYGWADRVLAYYPAHGDVAEIPNNSVKCGAPPRWSPSGDMIVYNVNSCGRGAPGGTLHLISVDGSYHETLLPYTNNNPQHFAIKPDGSSIIYTNDNGFSKISLYKHIPEFQTIAMLIMAISILPIVVFRKRLDVP